MNTTIMGYRLDFRPANPCYYTVGGYAQELESSRQGAETWALFPEPQPGCPTEVEVYLGVWWVRPRHAKGLDLTGFLPLYRGPLLHKPPMDEMVAHLFPSLVEDRLRDARPDLFPGGQ